LHILECHYHDNIRLLYNDLIKKSEYDILKCYQVDTQLPNLQKFYTLQINLNENLNDIFKKFAKNTRNEINKCYRDDKLLFLINEKINQKDIVEFIILFNKFNKFKNLGTNVNELEKSLVRKKENIAFFKAVKDNRIVVFNVYFVDNNRARLKCSVSLRGEDGKERNLIGRANRTLHFEAISFFKEKGYKLYDMGGVSLTEDKMGIDSFKSKFGGILFTEW